MIISAVKVVFAILIGYLAIVGLTQVCVTVGRWLSAGGRIKNCWLVVTARPGDHSIEMRLRQAHSQLVCSPALTGVRLVVLDADADSETQMICRCFCQEKNVPLARPDELPALLRGDKS